MRFLRGNHISPDIPDETDRRRGAPNRGCGRFVHSLHGYKHHRQSGYARELFKALRPLNIQWGAQASIMTAKDDELLKLAAASGCVFLLFGLESVNPDSVKDARKGWARPQLYSELLQKVRDAGIGVIGSFVFGFDSDTPDAFDRTVDFVMANKIEIAHFLPLTPIAGTNIRKKLEEEGRLIEPDEGQFDHDHASFHPRNMSKEELEAGIKYCWRTFYSNEAMHERLSDWTVGGRPINSELGSHAYSPSEIIHFLNRAYRREVKKRY